MRPASIIHPCKLVPVVPMVPMVPSPSGANGANPNGASPSDANTRARGCGRDGAVKRGRIEREADEGPLDRASTLLNRFEVCSLRSWDLSRVESR